MPYLAKSRAWVHNTINVLNSVNRNFNIVFAIKIFVIVIEIMITDRYALADLRFYTRLVRCELYLQVPS